MQFHKNQWLPWDMDKESELLDFGKATKIWSILKSELLDGQSLYVNKVTHYASLHSMMEVASETYRSSLMIQLQALLMLLNLSLDLLIYLKELWSNLQNQNNHLNFKLKLQINITPLWLVDVTELIQFKEDQTRLL